MPSFMPCLALAALSALPVQDPPAEPAAPGSPTADVLGVALLDHAALTERLRSLARESAVATLVPVGSSRAGRAIEAVRLSGGDPEPGRPAVLLVAGLEATRVFESGVALHHAEALARRYGRDGRVTELLDGTTVYVLPRANPDGAEAYFSAPRHGSPATGTDVDSDRDGRLGEDPPADVNGDGLVTQLRVVDPEGEWLPDPDDPRALALADPLEGQRGIYRVYPEGRDADGDGEVAEDPARDAEFNANFPAGWPEHEPRAGRFPMDEPGVRALADFVIARPELALVVTYGAQTNLVGKPAVARSGGGRVPEPGLIESDAELLESIAETYRELTGNESAESAPGEGSFQRWSYEHRGLWTLDAVLWSMPTEAPAPAPEEPEEPEEPGEGREGGPPAAGRGGERSDDAGHLAWIDATGESWRFVPWKPFRHPELGAVEIGGFAPHARVVPPESEWTPIAEGHLAFLLGLGELLPRVEIVAAEAEELGGGLLRLRAVIDNPAILPLPSAAARRARTQRPARVRLFGSGEGLIYAGQRQTLVSELAGSGGRRELVWLVTGGAPGDFELRVDTDNAGRARRTFEVKR